MFKKKDARFVKAMFTGEGEHGSMDYEISDVSSQELALLIVQLFGEFPAEDQDKIVEALKKVRSDGGSIETHPVN